MATPLTQIQLLKLTHKRNGRIIYRWFGNDGWTYSPEFTDRKSAEDWPKTDGLKPLTYWVGEEPTSLETLGVA